MCWCVVKNLLSLSLSVSVACGTLAYLTSQKVLIGASGFHSSMMSGWWRHSSASIASCATSGIGCWWTRDTRPLISSRVLLWISWPALPGFYNRYNDDEMSTVIDSIYDTPLRVDIVSTECPDVKNYKWRLNLVKGLISSFWWIIVKLLTWKVSKQSRRFLMTC